MSTHHLILEFRRTARRGLRAFRPRRPHKALMFATAAAGTVVGVGLLAMLVPRLRAGIAGMFGGSPALAQLSSTTEANEGEGNRTAARRYDEAATAFAHSGKVEPAAAAARRAIDGPEASDLHDAEEKGKRGAIS